MGMDTTTKILNGKRDWVLPHFKVHKKSAENYKQVEESNTVEIWNYFK